MRKATVERKTKETRIRVALNLDGSGNSRIDSPIGFFNHLLETFARHGGFDLSMQISGDIHVDPHHTIEDSGIALGTAFRKALTDKKGIHRAGSFAFPMDEALAWAAVDISGRPYLKMTPNIKGKKYGDFDPECLEDFLAGFTTSLGASLHLKVCYGRSGHHKMEALFKSFARAMREACSLDSRLSSVIPSTKEVL
ncbi:MAG: imidazoleglycerol-phosphate dehydratase HisB [Candidatus Aminicenantales bacterium]